MYERFLRNFTGIDVPKSQQLEGLNFEVILTSDESERGCVVPVDIADGGVGIDLRDPAPRFGQPQLLSSSPRLGGGRPWLRDREEHEHVVGMQ
jgi:hypothetical protein